MADDEPLAADVAAAAPPATKAKRTKVEKLTAELATAEGKLKGLEAQHKALAAACKLGRRKLTADALARRDTAAGQVRGAGSPSARGGTLSCLGGDVDTECLLPPGRQHTHARRSESSNRFHSRPMMDEQKAKEDIIISDTGRLPCDGVQPGVARI